MNMNYGQSEVYYSIHGLGTEQDKHGLVVLVQVRQYYYTLITPQKAK